MSNRYAGRRRKNGSGIRGLMSPVSVVMFGVMVGYVVWGRRGREEWGGLNGVSGVKGVIGGEEGSVELELGVEDRNDTGGGGVGVAFEEGSGGAEEVRDRHERDKERRRRARKGVHERVGEKLKEETDGEDKGKKKTEGSGAVPEGARTSGKLEEFKGSDGGSVDGMVRGQNVTRVSYTLYKVMRLFGFTGLTDSPAGAHAEWMVDLVRRMAYEVPFFVYKGVDGVEGLGRAKERMGGVVDGEYFEGDAETALPDGTDVLFHWTELDGGERDPRGRGYLKHMARVVRTAKMGGFGYLVFGQFPRLNGPSPVFRKGKWKFVGTEEEEPFLLNEHVRGVVPTASGGKAYMLYLTFYSLRSIPMEAIEGMDVEASKEGWAGV